MTFPKGHQEMGESLVETAVREIKEETGLEGLRYIAPVGRTLFRFRREGTTIEKTVYFFLIRSATRSKRSAYRRRRDLGGSMGKGRQSLRDQRIPQSRPSFVQGLAHRLS
jgi:ADP-ribose pyrophosphatase YjhB (NUDIX family)